MLCKVLEQCGRSEKNQAEYNRWFPKIQFSSQKKTKMDV